MTPALFVEAAKSAEAVGHGWVALAAVLVGGAGTKVIDRCFAIRENQKKAEEKAKEKAAEAQAKVEETRRKEIAAEEAEIRTEIRQQLLDLRTELKETRLHVEDLQVMVDEWREKYYANVSENLELNRKYVALQADYALLSHNYQELKSEQAGLPCKTGLVQLRDTNERN